MNGHIPESFAQFEDDFKRKMENVLPEPFENEYECLSVLAENPERSVFIVREKNTGLKRIFKVTSETTGNSAKSEYKFLSRLGHPAIPKAIRFEKIEDKGVLIREYVEGETLAERVSRNGPFSVRETLDLARQVCDVLSFLHLQSPPIIYKDIKPQNIILSPDVKIHLIDFGISREYDPTKTTDTKIIGSFQYASPEHLGFRSTDTRSDIFSLGRLINFLATGDAFTFPGDPALVRIASRCTDVSPDKRFPSAIALSKEITRLLNPIPKKEKIRFAAAFIGAFLLGTLILLKFILPRPDLRERVDPAAQTLAVVEAAEISIRVQALENGKPIQNAAVSADYHHWYIPDSSGKATLSLPAFQQYTIVVAKGNQTVRKTVGAESAEARSLNQIDLNAAPYAPEEIRLKGNFGEALSFPLELTNVDSVALKGNPIEIEVAQPDDSPNQDGADEWILTVSESIAQPGIYPIFLTGSNENGRVQTLVELNLMVNKPETLVSTIEDLGQIRNNPDGKYVLTKDLDLSDVESWNPIGSKDAPFTGTLDGKGHRIHGLSISSGNIAGVFGYIRHAAIRNIILVGPKIRLVEPTMYTGVGGIVGINSLSLIENCAVLDGEIYADVVFESGAGGILGVNEDGIVRHVFNSASITIENNGSRNESDSNSGGIAGANSGYISDAANSGRISGPSLVGGISAFNNEGIITRTLNSGMIQGMHYIQNAAYPPGAISHLLGAGRLISDSVFLETTAIKGATVWNGGTLLNIVPMSDERLRSLSEVRTIFGSADEGRNWTMKPEISPYPIPARIFDSDELSRIEK